MNEYEEIMECINEMIELNDADILSDDLDTHCAAADISIWANDLVVKINKKLNKIPNTCKYCDNETPEIIHLIETYHVYCNKCKASGPHCETKEEAMIKWSL